MPSPSTRRDTLLSAVVLAGVAIPAWIYTARMALMPAGMDMGDMSMPMDMPMDMPMSGGMDWTGASYGSLYLMWAVMMVAMMLPSAAPAILTYRSADADRSPLAARGGFLLGYLATWAGFSAVAALIQLQLNRAMLLTPAGASTRPLLTAALLLAAGLYQFSPLKRTCLGRCRLPLAGTDPGGAFRAGVAYGTQCVGCCWLLMLLLFVAGVMTLWWVAVLSVVVFVERVGPWRRWAERLIGAGCLVAAAWISLAR